MKRDIAIILLPEGISPSDVRSPAGSYVLHVWFESETALESDGGLVARALARAGRTIARRVAERVS